jgi:excinuclease ABC subunit A
MLNVGLDYLTLNRSAATLSGGEAQRIRLASQLGTGLVGALYVLDEPTIGLHQRDNDRLIKTLLTLKELGNTILVVEHDEDTIYASDYLVDIGPGAGTHGGKVVATGWLDDCSPRPRTRAVAHARVPAREKEIPVPEERRTSEKGSIKIKRRDAPQPQESEYRCAARQARLHHGRLGLGKSTFLYDILHKNVAARFAKREAKLEHVASSMTGTEYIGRVVLIDQSPIGRTPRSNPATYTGAITHIRDLFAATPKRAHAAGSRDASPSMSPGGRCEACQGNGIAVEMHFLPTVYVTCDVCNGTRFMKETLEVTYRGKNIYEVLQMTIEEAEAFFKDIPAINDRLETLNSTGSSTSRSGSRDDAFGRRSAAREDSERALSPDDDEDALSARRADGRPPLRRREASSSRSSRSSCAAAIRSSSSSTISMSSSRRLSHRLRSGRRHQAAARSSRRERRRRPFVLLKVVTR